MVSWPLLALASAFFAGLTALFGKIGVRDIPSNLATLIRVIILLPLLFIIVSFSKESFSLKSLSSHDMIFLVLSAVTTGLSWLFYYAALKAGPASLVSAVDKLSLIFVFFLAAFFLHEKLSLQQWAGAALIVLGGLLIVI